MESKPVLKQGLIVEDQPATAEWLLARAHETFPDLQVSLAPNLAQGRKLIAAQRFDVALLDLGLPDGSGLDLIRLLVTEQPDCIRVVTTIYTDDHHVFPALRAGAQGYLLKDQPPHKVSAALQGIVQGEPPLSPTIARRLMAVFSQPESDADEAVRLSPREKQTLTLVAKGWKVSEVAEHMQVTTNTASGYVKSVYRKLDVNNRSEATIEAVRLGLVRTEI